MKKISKKLGLQSIMMVIMLLVVPSNVAAITHMSNFETMDTGVFPMTALCSDNIVGKHNYGQAWFPWDNPLNAHDLRGIWRPGDDVQINIDCSAWNNGLLPGRSVHIYSLEVYKEATWVAQGNPEYTDFWQIQLNQNQQAQNTLTVTITPQDCEQFPEWCVYYTCEVIDLDQQGPPPTYFLIDWNNYWVVLR